MVLFAATQVFLPQFFIKNTANFMKQKDKPKSRITLLESQIL